MTEMEAKWRGVVISESLDEPSIINDFEVYKARISKEDFEIGDGKKGRWHVYWVYVTEEQIESLKGIIKKDWYAHFWKGDKMVAVFRRRSFDFLSSDKTTWKSPVEYGKSPGIPEEQLDFPTE